MSWKLSIYGIFLVPIILMMTVVFGIAANKELKFPLPVFSALKTPNQCRCKAILSTGIYGNTLQDKGILGELSKGSDEISVQIKDDMLYFLSSASFKLGEAKPAEFKIIYNSDREVLATCSQETLFGYTVDIFTLNKNNGMAVWTKTRSNDAVSGGTPSGQSFYLKCW